MASTCQHARTRNSAGMHPPALQLQDRDVPDRPPPPSLGRGSDQALTVVTPTSQANILGTSTLASCLDDPLSAGPYEASITMSALSSRRLALPGSRPVPYRFFVDEDARLFAVVPGRAGAMLPFQFPERDVHKLQSIGSRGSQTPCPGPATSLTPPDNLKLASTRACGLRDEDAIVFVPGRAGVTLPHQVSLHDLQGHESNGSPGATT
uniref:Uncharacterized protein n=1 Tax=Peronospora matthiolae TaxID=2874970 RepID=A0AAV1U8U1_9STRA